MDTIIAGTVVTIAKGCKARSVTKGTRAHVNSVTALGADYGHAVRVVLAFGGGTRVLSFYARHANRLADPIVRLNDGNPLHVIEVVRVRA